MKKIGVIGIGNLLRRDDAIGLILLKKLSERKNELPKDISLIDGGTGGMNLLHLLAKFDVVIIIDAVNFNGNIGESRLFRLEDIYSKKTPITISTHESNFLNIIQLSEELGERPKLLFVFGVQPKDISHGMNISSELQQKVGFLLDDLKHEIKTIFESVS